MDPDVMALFHELADLSPSDREAYFARARVPSAVRAEVESLLRFDGSSGPTLGAYVEAAAENAVLETAHERAGARYGSYRLIRLLGRGGMGTVYEAEQDRPRRRVALKLIKPGFASPELVRRFEQESQALGRLHHPGIAQIYEAGTADVGDGPQPYFAMELVGGEPLVEYAESQRLNSRQRLELLARVCDAVEHAHQRGIIHRDLKPGNILVDETGQPKILDFGVARVTDSDVQSTRHTDVGQLIGTLAYMSPEQVLADPLEVDTRSDVYALGVILYELLSNRLPYNTSGKLHEIARAIREDDPTPLAMSNRAFRGDIETIVSKALEKDVARRYGSAAALAADIRRYLGNEPIAARPPSTMYQLRKFTSRHKAFVAGLAAVVIVLVVGAAVSMWQAARARRAERAAEQEAAQARAINEFLESDLLAQAGTSAQSGKPDPDLKVKTALDRAAQRIGDRFKDQPLVEASLRLTIWKTYKDLGLFAAGQEHVERALELRNRALGPMHQLTLGSIGEVAVHYQDQGRLAEAEALVVKQLDGLRRTLGERHLDTLTAMNNLALLYREQRKYGLAEPLQIKVLEIRRRDLGEEHPRTQINMTNLGLTYMELGKYAEAERLFTRVVEIRRRLAGEEHPTTLNSVSNLAGLHYSVGNFETSEQLFTKVIEVKRRVRGNEHPDTLFSLSALGKVYDAQGKNDRAEELYTNLVEVERRVLGENHPDLLLTMNNLGILFGKQGKYAQADELLTKVLGARRRAQKSTPVETANTLSWLAILSLEQGRHAEGEKLAREADSIYQSGWPENWRRYRAQSVLGDALARQKRFAEAEPLLLSGHEGLASREALIPAPERNAVQDAASRVQRLYESSGQQEKAAAWRVRTNRGT